MTKKIESENKAKQRMRAYLKSIGVDYSAAEKACGYKRGFFSAGGIVGSDKLAMFMEAYPKADLYYIVTGHQDARRLQMVKALQNIAAEIIDILPTPK